MLNPAIFRCNTVCAILYPNFVPLLSKLNDLCCSCSVGQPETLR